MIYLSNEWFAQAKAQVAAITQPIGSADYVRFSYTIEGLPDDHPRAGQTIRYQVALDPSAGTAELVETDEPGDVRFALQYSTAYEVASGGRGGSRAFLDGDIQIGGEVAVLIARADELEALSAALPSPTGSDA